MYHQCYTRNADKLSHDTRCQNILRTKNIYRDSYCKLSTLFTLTKIFGCKQHHRDFIAYFPHLMINVFLRYYYRDLLHILLTYVFYIFAKNIIVILYKIFCTLFTLTLSTLLQSILSSSITLFLHRCKECY